MSIDDPRGGLRRAASTRGIPGSTAWPWLCPTTGGTACEILEVKEQADRRVEAWYGEVHRYPTIGDCGERMPAGTVDLILLNRTDWDGGRGAEASLRECVDLLRPGGYAIFMLANDRFRTFLPKAWLAGSSPGVSSRSKSPYLPLRGLERRCGALGFSRLQVYLCSDEPGYIQSLVPHERTALFAGEGLRMPKGVRGRIRLGVAAIGLGSRLYPWVLVIAER